MGSAGPLHTGRLTWNAPQACELWFLFNSQLPSVFFPGSFFPQQVLIANVTKDWPLRSQPHAQPNTQRDPMLFSVAPSLTSSLFSRTIPHRSRQFSPCGLPSLSSWLCLDSACLCCVALLFPVSGDFSPAVSCTNSGPSYFVYFASIIVVYRVVYLGSSYPITARGVRGQCFHFWANWWDEVLADKWRWSQNLSSPLPPRTTVRRLGYWVSFFCSFLLQDKADAWKLAWPQFRAFYCPPSPELSTFQLYVYVCAQSCLTLWDPMDCSPPDSSIHFPDKNTGVGCHFLLQGIFLTQGSNLHLLHWQMDSLPLHHSII